MLLERGKEELMAQEGVLNILVALLNDDQAHPPARLTALQCVGMLLNSGAECASVNHVMNVQRLQNMQAVQPAAPVVNASYSNSSLLIH